MEQSIRCGVDIAKLVFQIHGVNANLRGQPWGQPWGQPSGSDTVVSTEN